MAILCFSDVLKKVGLSPDKVLLIRHALSDKGFHACFDNNMVEEYTSHQRRGFGKGYTHWAVFVSEKGTLCKLHSLYRVDGELPDTQDRIPNGLPTIDANNFQGENSLFQLTRIDTLQEYENHLVIDWGKATRSWYQKGTTEKPIFALQNNPFPGFDEMRLSFGELENIINNGQAFSEWQAAMSSVDAVYVIADKVTGKLYVGSAYGQGGLWGRWSTYVQTNGTGGNKKLAELLKDDKTRCQFLQFSILQILQKNMSNDEIIRIETVWKNKLLSNSKEFGLNDN